MKAFKATVICSVFLVIFAAPIKAELRVNASGVSVDSGGDESYLNLGAGEGSAGIGIRDNQGSLEYRADGGGSWSAFGGLGVWKAFNKYVYPAGEEASYDPDVWVCIGNQTPQTLLHIYDFDTDSSGAERHRPQLYLFQDGAGDAAQRFSLSLAGGDSQHFSIGIDQRFSDAGQGALVSTDFKICHESYEEVGGTVPETMGYLKGESYSSAEMMLRIHAADWTGAAPDKQSAGIIDFNHQSRARYYAVTVLPEAPVKNFAMPGFWTPVLFDAGVNQTDCWDEHVEMHVVNDGSFFFSRFTAREEGYYQVNSRIVFALAAESMEPSFTCEPACCDSHVSIAIYHYSGADTTMYSQGNNLQIINGRLCFWYVSTTGGGINNPGLLPKNNAPNVSDVVYLKKGEGIEIRMYQDTALPIELDVSPPARVKNYISIHKIS